MIKAFAVLLSLGFLASLAAAPPATGDVNGDGKVDRADAQIILQRAVSAVVLGQSDMAAADVNGDGQINSLDAILVLRSGAASSTPELAGYSAVATLNQRGVEVSLLFDGASRAVDRTIQVRLLNLEGAALETNEVVLAESAGAKRGVASFRLEGITNQVDLANYIVEVIGGPNGAAFQERSSLYQLTPRLAAHVAGPKSFLAGARERLRIVTEDAASGLPLAGAAVEISLQPACATNPVTLFQGTTDSRGLSEPSITMPAGSAGEGKLTVRVKSLAGDRTLDQQVRVEERFATYLTTDKPLYQPGQTIHFRSLTLTKPDLLPAAGREITLTVADSKGNKVFRQVKPVSEYGISAADFTLAAELNMGTYTISAAVGGQQTEKKVEVKRYALPKFKVTLNTDQSYYRPGAKVSGTVAANYFFGKTVAGAKATVSASKFDVDLTEFAKVSGTTDAQGTFTFSIDLPSHFVGQPLEQGEAFALLEVEVEDAAAHVETMNQRVAVAASDLVILAVPESGRLVAGTENKVYLLATYPNNTPARAQCTVVVGGQALTAISTDEAGVGVVQFTPAGTSDIVMQVRAQDASGHTAEKSFTLVLNQSPDSLLLRTDRTLYAVGQEVLVDIFGGASGGSAFVDVVKDGQTLYSRTLEVEAGRSSLAIPLSAEMSGTLAVSAYRITLRGDTVRDRKVIYVDPANELRLSYELSKDTYLPGEDATIRLHVADNQNRPVPAAIGLNIVDESVFALQEMQPGMEKVYFYLEEQLRKPKYEVHGFEIETILLDPQPVDSTPSRDQALGLMFASVSGQESGLFELSTRSGESSALQNKLGEAIWKDLGPLIDGLLKVLGSYPTNQPSAFFEDRVQEAIQKGNLTEAGASDPWGHPYRIRYEQPTDTYYFESAGPDERWQTGDDLAFSTARWMLADSFLRANPTLVLFRKDFDLFLFDVATTGMPVANSAGGPVPPVVSATSEGAAAPYVRNYFPETLYSNPSLITGPDGNAEVNLKMADSITSWRLTGLASSANGRLGSATAAFRTFQEFFVDLDLPPALTRGDEVSVPVAIYNYLADAQEIRLVLEQADWFELTGPVEKTVRLEANQVSVAYFPIKTIKVGHHKLQVTAFGSARSDALVREIEVAADGSEVLISQSGRLTGTVEKSITIPPEALEGASKILVKIYPGLFSQVVEGLDSLLQMPSGCFEQTSSVTYPNVLALQYMKAVGQVTPEIQMKAEGFIGTGYQRLLSFEVPGGGFEWFGNTPAHNLLTTYGLMEFSDMSKVWFVDPAVIARTQEWLVHQQKPDGSWIPTDGGIAEGAIDRYQNDVLRTTAYIVWGLTASGYTGPAVASGISFVKTQLGSAGLKPETYTLALCAQALLQNPEDAALPALFREFEARKQTEGDNAWWEGNAPTITFSRGKGADVELTALLAQAYMRFGQYPDTAAKALNYLVSAKNGDGNFGSTQATVLALKAFAMAASGATVPPNASVRISINDLEAKRLELNSETKDLLFLVDLQAQTLAGENKVRISLEGTGSSLYQIVGRYYVPWDLAGPSVEEPIHIDVSYDKTELTTRDTVRCKVRIANNRPAKAKMVVVDLGLPPGFNILTEDLDALVGSKFKKYQLTGRQAIFYFDELAQESPIEFSFRLAAKYPIRATTAQSVVYEYYNPEIRAVAAPKQLAVTE